MAAYLHVRFLGWPRGQKGRGEDGLMAGCAGGPSGVRVA